MLQPHMIETGVFDIPLMLAPSLEGQRAFLQTMLLGAQRRLRRFAQSYGWLDHMLTPFAIRAQMYLLKERFDHDLLALVGMDTNTQLPSTYCAALEEQVLMSVSPELYAELYPEGNEVDAFEKLLTHEMAHRLHIRILNGDEERMGPIWFYEGFALYAANQFEAFLPVLNKDEIWEVVRTEERIDYRRYASVFRYLLNFVSLEQLVDRGGIAEFLCWLQQNTG